MGAVPEKVWTASCRAQQFGSRKGDHDTRSMRPEFRSERGLSGVACDRSKVAKSEMSGVNMTSRKQTARVAGALYLVMGLAGAFSIMYIPRFFMIPGDAAATASNILS